MRSKQQQDLEQTCTMAMIFVGTIAGLAAVFLAVMS